MKKLFSKALFKQTCKANGMMWLIITFALCFMLTCVMIISGSGVIGKAKKGVQNTIITKEIDAKIQSESLKYYTSMQDNLKTFDKEFVNRIDDCLFYYIQLNLYDTTRPSENVYLTSASFEEAFSIWKEKMPKALNDTSKAFKALYDDWLENLVRKNDYNNLIEYEQALLKWKNETPLNEESLGKVVYEKTLYYMQDLLFSNALKENAEFDKDSLEAKELIGSLAFALNPNGILDEEFEKNNETSVTYDVESLVNHVLITDIDTYIDSTERNNYIEEHCRNVMSTFVAYSLTNESNISILLEALSAYGITYEKYLSFNYNYANVKYMSMTTIITYKNRLDYEKILINEDLNNGIITDAEAEVKLKEKEDYLKKDISKSFLSSLPSETAIALEEVGKMDLYVLIVGSIFYKLAGLLLPIIYMIMCSNNLIAGQVDSGSMAYILSTSTKRSTVIFTQALYLIGSIFLMFVLTSLTGSICLLCLNQDVTLNIASFITLNIGAFLVLFCLSGLCFFTSCYFDRSKRSMAIGGGLSVLALVTAMLGLFGSKMIPSIVRLEALNYFNYCTILSFFDIDAIVSNDLIFMLKFLVLAVLGAIGFIAGAITFTKKDLPL